MSVVKKGFSRDVESDQRQIDESIEERKRFNESKLHDLESRKKLRIGVAIGVGILMFSQLTGLFFFLNKAFNQNIIKDLQWLFGTVFGGLFTETYVLTRLIVIWLFKDVPYKPDLQER